MEIENVGRERGRRRCGGGSGSNQRRSGRLARKRRTEGKGGEEKRSYLAEHPLFKHTADHSVVEFEVLGDKS
jgi:hypothetical protein